MPYELPPGLALIACPECEGKKPAQFVCERCDASGHLLVFEEVL